MCVVCVGRERKIRLSGIMAIIKLFFYFWTEWCKGLAYVGYFPPQFGFKNIVNAQDLFQLVLHFQVLEISLCIDINHFIEQEFRISLLICLDKACLISLILG